MTEFLPNRLKAGALFNVLILSCLIALSVQAGAEAAEQAGESSHVYMFYKANSFYEEGDYDKAIDEYTKVLEEGVESGSLYYNLGNCYFKKGDIGRAVLNYERAKRLIPRDSDLDSNYRFALSRIKDGPRKVKPRLSERVLNISGSLNINELTLLLSALYTLAVMFMVLRMFVPSARKYGMAFLSVSLVLILLTAFSLFSRISVLGKEFIVTGATTEALFEPLDNATRHFTLHEGMKVIMLNSKDDWAKIKRNDGKIGWVKIHDIAKI